MSDVVLGLPDRITWLKGLTFPQLRVIARQSGIDRWNSKDQETLLRELTDIEGVETPIKV
jgi:hypothetical protein